VQQQLRYFDFGYDEQRNDNAVDGDRFTEDDADEILSSDARRSHACAQHTGASVKDPSEQNNNHHAASWLRPGSGEWSPLCH